MFFVSIFCLAICCSQVLSLCKPNYNTSTPLVDTEKHDASPREGSLLLMETHRAQPWAVTVLRITFSQSYLVQNHTHLPGSPLSVASQPGVVTDPKKLAQLRTILKDYSSYALQGSAALSLNWGTAQSTVPLARLAFSSSWAHGKLPFVGTLELRSRSSCKNVGQTSVTDCLVHVNVQAKPRLLFLLCRRGAGDTRTPLTLGVESNEDTRRSLWVF